MEDLRERILSSIKDMVITASIIADDGGIVVGTSEVKEEAERLGLFLEMILSEGARIERGDEIVRFRGSPQQIAIAEEMLIGLIAKPSGIATSTFEAVEATRGKPKIVCGAWKKMPWVLKDVIRRAIAIGGGMTHISSHPFVYLDKNYIEMFGGIERSLEAVKDLKSYLKVVQLKGKYNDIGLEACEATQLGADILFIDTGKRSDVITVIEKLVELGLRHKVNIAFGGGIRLETIEEFKALDIDILDIGRQIVDAPLLDMRLEVWNTNAKLLQ